MCTVTFLPVNSRDFILTSNRDEGINRPIALPVQSYNIANATIYFPKDPQGNGSWIAHAENGYTLCLLNGGFKPHIRKSSYRKSRGLVLLDFYNYNDPEKFARDYDFEGIEPFTLIMVYSGADTKNTILYELKWDEIKPVLIAHDASQPAIWSSTMLYTPETIEQRREWFVTWLQKNKVYTPVAILFFHHFGGEGSLYNDVLMNRGNVKTVSITCINNSGPITEILYEDLVMSQRYKNEIINR